jgi:hypothetical protein
MSVRKAIPEKDGVYFITFTCLPAGRPATTGCHYLKSAMLMMQFTPGSII